MDGQTQTYPVTLPDGTKILLCCDCHEEFVFTKDAQDYFNEKGYTEDPKRCRICFQHHKDQQRVH